eukprot:CAMPEP_0119054196 /NCGR_PEP_ID=MMETSP1177-20130426/74910_1 /TAXON_ID=2985 /ORGANISM="Ochromonas sp, Strain CCMP1899" /LENGTH=202 /DNA_ID=CAMNT_0007034355 /DNA_START=1519 /DNA_END=2124 /DNA_ORIENTATION=+
MVNQQNGLLLPGESTDIRVTVMVDRKTSQSLNIGQEILDDILVLRIENSVDYYVSVSGVFLRSCYGLSLEELVYTPQPIRDTKLPAIDSNTQEMYEDPQMMIPKEIWRLIDALWGGKALREKDLFVSANVNLNEVALIRECLDTNVPLPVSTPHSVVEALITLLGALSKPLLPIELYPQGEIDQNNMKNFCKKFLDTLPPLN